MEVQGSSLLTIEQASSILKGEGVVAVPTETVYGLAALASSSKAVERVYALKKRPSKNPLILHLCSLEQLERYVDLNSLSMSARELFSLWPGPLTLVLPRKESSHSLLAQKVYSELPTLAVRIPGHEGLRELIEMTGPLVAPSANKSGLPSPTCAKHIIQDYQAEVPILGDGKEFCLQGMESSILCPCREIGSSESGLAFRDGSCWKLLRPGAISLTEIAASLSGSCREVYAQDGGAIDCSQENLQLKNCKHEQRPIAPGQMFTHYTPKASVHLGSKEGRWQDNEAVIGIKGRSYPGSNTLFLFHPDKPQSLMPHFYHLLREVDRLGLDSVFIDDVFLQIRSPAWQTLRERFSRCSS